MLALAALPACEQSARAAAEGTRWLLGLQNRDGGWPTFCRGWGKLPFDRSGCDLTAHVLRALHAWRDRTPAALSKRAARASRRGLRFLACSQRTDGSWLPLWFGSQRTADQANPVFGTARVLLAYHDLGLADDPCARRGRAYLRQASGEGGGWGAAAGAEPTIEETAATTEALAGSGDREDGLVARRGVEWLCGRLAGAGGLPACPIGLYFARLWYSEILYPISLAAAALRRAIEAGLGGIGDSPPRRAE
jgi:squalene-hopene/tetraprenyl-beta-curcumene cyclase